MLLSFRNTTVGLEHVETPVDMKMWPLFHNGVAAGLRIAQGISQVRMRDWLAVCGACVSLIHSLICVEARLKLN